MNCRGIGVAFAFSLTLSCGMGNKGNEDLQHRLSGNFSEENRKTSETSGTNGPVCPDVCAAVCSGQPEPEIPQGCPIPACSCGSEGQQSYNGDLCQSGDCPQRRSQIEAALDEVAICSIDADCSYKGLHPHYGCFFTFNKSRNTTLVEELVNSYSTSECWDGSTTDCARVDREMLKCKNSRCIFEW